jgi:hypothetical protein
VGGIYAVETSADYKKGESKMSTSIYRYYVLSYSGKGGGGCGYRGGSLGVIAEDVIHAVHLAQQLKPEMTVWNVSHHGIVHGIAVKAAVDLVMAE